MRLEDLRHAYERAVEEARSTRQHILQLAEEAARNNLRYSEAVHRLQLDRHKDNLNAHQARIQWQLDPANQPLRHQLQETEANLAAALRATEEQRQQLEQLADDWRQAMERAQASDALRDRFQQYIQLWQKEQQRFEEAIRNREQNLAQLTEEHINVRTAYDALRTEAEREVARLRTLQQHHQRIAQRNLEAEEQRNRALLLENQQETTNLILRTMPPLPKPSPKPNKAVEPTVPYPEKPSGQFQTELRPGLHAKPKPKPKPQAQADTVVANLPVFVPTPTPKPKPKPQDQPTAASVATLLLPFQPVPSGPSSAGGGPPPDPPPPSGPSQPTLDPLPPGPHVTPSQSSMQGPNPFFNNAPPPTAAPSPIQTDDRNKGRGRGFDVAPDILDPRRARHKLFSDFRNALIGTVRPDPRMPRDVGAVTPLRFQA